MSESGNPGYVGW